MKYLLILVFYFLSGKILYSQSNQIVPPYFNSFDNPSDTVGWYHTASYGTDDWELGTPNNIFTSSYSNPNGWTNYLNSSYATNSVRYLKTPYFDLSDTTKNYNFSFYQKTKGNTAKFNIYYTISTGSNWIKLDHSNPFKKFNWQTTNGFFNNYTQFVRSAVSLEELKGLDSVKFIFQTNTGNVDSSGDGWLLDNFEISDAKYNIYTSRGDTIKNINKNFDFFIVKYSGFVNQPWSEPFKIKKNFYFSTDSIFDPGDLFLESKTSSLTYQAIWNDTLLLPDSIPAGQYYIIHFLDATDTLKETNESDNWDYSVFRMDSIYSADYYTDFEDNRDDWNGSELSLNSRWKKGDPEFFSMEEPRSGENAWFTQTIPFENYGSTLNIVLETPYIDLSNSINSTICFWYRNFYSGTNPTHYFRFPTIENKITLPHFSNSLADTIEVRETRGFGWDCSCIKIDNYDGYKSTKFIIAQRSIDKPIVIDDLYIGTAKPDVAIECNKKNLFSDYSNTIDTLTYILFNSGLDSLPATITEFYWSSDTIFDIGDIFLGVNSEPSLTDTSFIWRKFAYSKPNPSSGKFYIFYKVDATGLINEMREYDNSGYFEIFEIYPKTLPYYNDFESEIDGWRHNASLGADQWEWTTPSSTNIPQAISGVKGWVTKATGVTDSLARMHLYTPVFDLTQLQHPVLEFDLISAFHDYYNSNLYMNGGNIMYSIDGGANWITLEPKNSSFKRMYSPIFYSYNNGHDYYSTDRRINILYGKNEKSFVYSDTYSGRDYDEYYRYVVDLNFLKFYKSIQFMFVYGSNSRFVDGMLVDNFIIREAYSDLYIPEEKELLVNNADKFMKFNLDVKNNGNYETDTTAIEFYLSIDSTFSANDTLIGSKRIPRIQPYKKYNFGISVATPSNFGNYNYIIYKIDPLLKISDSNISNNEGYIKLNMDSLERSDYPILFDYNENINGWSWYNDSTIYTNKAFRFRTKTVPGEIVSSAKDGEFFLDLIGASLNFIPVYYIESPTYDFSQLCQIELSFDFLSVGAGGIYNEGGGNIDYSVDGGANWNLLGKYNDSSGVNWYSLPNLSALQNEPGWGANSNTNYLNAKYNLAFLAKEKNVKFRFKYRSIAFVGILHSGFRLDNFKIESKVVDYVAKDSAGDLIITENTPSLMLNYEIQNTGDIDGLSTRTIFYWSKDKVLDSTDTFLKAIAHHPVPSNSIQNFSTPIDLPLLDGDSIYYIIYKIDADSIVCESDESNNKGIFTINVDRINLIPELENLNFYIIDNQIKLTKPISEELEVVINNLLGQQVYHLNIRNYSKSLNISLPNHLSTGLYFVTLKTGSKSISKKVLIQNL